MTISSRIDNVTLINDAYRGPICPPPKSVKIEITSTCNLHCSFCVKSIKEESGHMDRALYSRLLQEIHDAGVKEIGMFFIGESFTCPWLPDAIKEAKDIGMEYVFLTTNGTAGSPAKIQQCMEAGLDSLKFSLNFHSAEQMADIAKVSPTYWRRAIDNLKAAWKIKEEKGYSCGIYASSIKFDGAQGEAMQAVIDEIRPFVTEHYLLPLYGMSGAAKANGFKPQPGNPGRLDALRDPLPCWSAFTEAHITKDGLLAACCFGTGSDGDLVMADLKEVSFKEGWNSLPFQALRKAHLAKDVSGTACSTCAAG